MFVDLAGNEMALLIEMVVDLGMNGARTVPQNLQGQLLGYAKRASRLLQPHDHVNRGDPLPLGGEISISGNWWSGMSDNSSVSSK